MTITPKHQKVLALAQAKTGCPLGIYSKEANELRAAGMIECREHFSAVGSRSLRWFHPRKED